LYRSINFNGTIAEKEKKLKNTAIKLMQEYGVTWIRNYSNVDKDGRIFFAKDLSTPGTPRVLSIPEINLHLEPLDTRGWSSDDKFIKLHNQGLLHFKGKRPYEIHYLEDAVDNVSSILDFYSHQGTEDLKKLGINNIFDTAKPVELIKYLIRLGTDNNNDKILDFFAGSGTTAQAVIEVNIEDGKNLEFTLIQIEEPIDSKSKAYEKCLELKIDPKVSELMIYRINRFLKLNDYNSEIKIYR
jgi:adenine-specific DNA-methyltransferase